MKCYTQKIFELNKDTRTSNDSKNTKDVFTRNAAISCTYV